MFSIRTHAMGRLCRLSSAQPQIDHSVKTASWNFLVFPAVYLDKTARKSLQTYRAWFKEQTKEARSRSSTLKELKGEDFVVPRVSVSVITLNLAVLWTGEDDEENAASEGHGTSDQAESPAHPAYSFEVDQDQDPTSLPMAPMKSGRDDTNTVLSVSGQPTYLGKWHSPTVPLHWFRRAMRRWCPSRNVKSELSRDKLSRPPHAARRSATWAPTGGSTDEQLQRTDSTPPADEEQPLLGEDPDSETDPLEEEAEEEMMQTDDLVRELRQKEEEEEAEANTTFPETFKQVLYQLDSDNSVLRMGSHRTLAFRLVLQGTAEYMDAITLYKAAISRIRHYLRSENVKNKDSLIAKISVAKLELNSLLSMVEPFCNNVVPGLKEKAKGYSKKDTLESRIIRHYMIDIDGNMDQIISQCKAQIQVCETLIDEYERKAADRVNEILNFLTIITFLIMPMQILTGLYGMNFTHMPELHWKFGYHYFFGIALSFTALAALVLGCVYKAFT